MRGVRRLKRWAYRLWPAPAVVLMYHRVARPAVDPWALAVRPAHFDEHLDVLRRHGPVLSLAEAAAALRAGRLRRRATIVTFDDGYADNLHVAAPLLARRGVPATVFLTTGWLGTGRPAWWDALADLILGSHPLPQSLPDAPWAGLSAVALAAEVGWTPEAATAVPDAGWRAADPPPTPRHALYLALWRRLLPLADDARRPALDTITAWAAAPLAVSDGLPLTWDEVDALAIAPGVEIGAHTITHPGLDGLAGERVREEVGGSRAALEARIGKPVATFSYPYGRHGPAAEAVVTAAGFACAVTTDPRPVRPRADPLLLPRVQVPDVDGDGLARALREWRGRG